MAGDHGDQPLEVTYSQSHGGRKPLSPEEAKKWHGGGTHGKIPYPKHVWSPSGGWYAQPANWKMNTAILMGVCLGIGAILFKISAEIEERYQMPEPGRFYPSRYWSRQIIEHETREKAKREAAGGAS